MKHIMQLIGFFNLDPNRVYDLILDAFEMQPSANHGAFLRLLPLFSGEARVHQLGFKFQRLAERAEPTPLALYQIAAHMVKVRTRMHGLVLQGQHSCTEDLCMTKYI